MQNQEPEKQEEENPTQEIPPQAEQSTTPPPPPPPPPQESENSSAETAPSESIPKEHRTWAMACHLSALVGILGVPLGNVLGPLIVWLIKKEEMPFVKEQGKEALNFHITVFIAIFILVITIIGIPVAFIVGIVALVFTIIAGIKANDGVAYRYPWSIKFFK